MADVKSDNRKRPGILKQVPGLFSDLKCEYTFSQKWICVSKTANSNIIIKMNGIMHKYL